MSIDDMVRLIEAVAGHGLTSFVYENEEEKVTIKKKKKKTHAPVGQVIPMAQVGSMAQAIPVAQSVPLAGLMPELAPLPGAKAEPQLDIGSDKVVVSPLVGTFYSAASPDAEPFVKVGDTVKKGQVLGIIEAMKLMNEIESDFDGVVEAVLAKNEEVVEYGQPLFRIH